jgi:hypothetical protein
MFVAKICNDTIVTIYNELRVYGVVRSVQMKACVSGRNDIALELSLKRLSKDFVSQW